MTTIPQYYVNYCWNTRQLIEHGSHKSWDELLNSDGGSWLTERIAKQIGLYEDVGRKFVRWSINREFADYYTLRMDPSTMYRRLYHVLNTVRKVVDIKEIPNGTAGLVPREIWFELMLRRDVVLINMDYEIKYGDRWLPHYDLEVVYIDAWHRIYVEGMTRRRQKAWKKQNHDVAELWKIYANQQMYGIKGDRSGPSWYHSLKEAGEMIW